MARLRLGRGYGYRRWVTRNRLGEGGEEEGSRVRWLASSATEKRVG